MESRQISGSSLTLERKVFTLWVRNGSVRVKERSKRKERNLVLSKEQVLWFLSQAHRLVSLPLGSVLHGNEISLVLRRNSFGPYVKIEGSQPDYFIFVPFGINGVSLKRFRASIQHLLEVNWNQEQRNTQPVSRDGASYAQVLSHGALPHQATMDLLLERIACLESELSLVRAHLRLESAISARFLGPLEPFAEIQAAAATSEVQNPNVIEKTMMNLSPQIDSDHAASSSQEINGISDNLYRVNSTVDWPVFRAVDYLNASNSSVTRDLDLLEHMGGDFYGYSGTDALVSNLGNPLEISEQVISGERALALLPDSAVELCEIEEQVVPCDEEGFPDSHDGAGKFDEELFQESVSPAAQVSLDVSTDMALTDGVDGVVIPLQVLSPLVIQDDSLLEFEISRDISDLVLGLSNGVEVECPKHVTRFKGLKTPSTFSKKRLNKKSGVKVDVIGKIQVPDGTPLHQVRVIQEAMHLRAQMEAREKLLK